MVERECEDSQLLQDNFTVEVDHGLGSNVIYNDSFVHYHPCHYTQQMFKRMIQFR